MDQFLHALLQFPAVFFAGLLAICLLYWLLVIIGAADLNPFDHADAALDGATEGAVDGAVHGATDGAVEGAAHSHEAVVDAGPIMQVLAFLGLRKVPITISFSTFSLIGWFLAMVTRQAIEPVLGGVAAGAAATAVAVVGGFFATGLVTRPLSALFTEATRGVGRGGLTGRVVKVTTEVVDHERGQGEIDDGAGGIAIQIRTSPGVTLKRGDEAIVLEHDDKASIYTVLPHNALLPTDDEQAARNAPPVDGGAAKPVEVAEPATVDRK